MVEDGQRHAPAALSLGKRPGTYCVGGCVGPRGGPVRKILLLPEFDPWTFQPVASPYTDCDIPACATIFNKGKGKAVPLQAWSGPEGSRKLRFLDYMTTAQDGGKVVSLTHLPPLPPGNALGTHFC